MIVKLSLIGELNINEAAKFYDGTQTQKRSISKTGPGKFDVILKNKIESADVKFSAHAADRLKYRNIELKKNDVLRLNKAVEKARVKGSKESLILLKDLALIVSIKNNTVITAVDNGNLKENIFTNIDSTVVLRD